MCIPLEDQEFGFARVLKPPILAFYDLRNEAVLEVDKIVRAPIAFKLMVMDSPIKSGRWAVLGNVPLESHLQASVTFFKQDAISKRHYLYVEGEEELTDASECIGLERAAVWSAEHVEDRLRDYFDGVPNKWTQSLELK